MMAHGGEYFKNLRYMKWLQNLGPIVDTLKMNRDDSISLPFVDGLEETTKEGSPQLGLATVELKPISPF